MLNNVFTLVYNSSMFYFETMLIMIRAYCILSLYESFAFVVDAVTAWHRLILTEHVFRLPDQKPVHTYEIKFYEHCDRYVSRRYFSEFHMFGPFIRRRLTLSPLS